jgi:beta-N-acetylhexosaminidase
MNARAVILGLLGETLTRGERDFFRDADPWGFILFKRNVRDRSQLKALTAALRGAVGRDAPIFVDQEGGRVQRLVSPEWRDRPAARLFANLDKTDPARAVEAARLSHRLMAHDLREVGIDADCAPVLDIPQSGADPIIGDRAFGVAPKAVSVLARAALEGLAEGGVVGVIKHIPGHGRADVDSHLELPRVKAGARELEAVDLAPFKALADAPMAMTAHVVYSAWDADRPATTSPTVIAEIVRGKIGFDGLLMTDDLSMKALKGGYGERAAAALAAGCDVILHCNGERAEMEPIVAVAPRLAGKSFERAARAEAARGAPQAFDATDGQARLDALLAGAVA